MADECCSIASWRLGVLFAVSTVAAAIVSCSGSATSSATYSQQDLVVGTGQSANTGNRVTVSYTGWLYDSGKPEGKDRQFDSSQNFAFSLGAGEVIKGWDQGVAGMHVGGKRRLVIPPDLAYGESGAGGVIPPNTTLVFDVTLLNVE